MSKRVMQWLKRHRKIGIIGVTSVFISLVLVVLSAQVAVILENRNGDIATTGKAYITIGSASVKAAGTADYTCDGVADDVQFQAAIDALPTTGGTVKILTGVYTLTATVTRAIPNVNIEGNGISTYIAYDGINPTFIAGANNWTFSYLRTDAGSINMGVTTGWMWTNVTIGTTYYGYRSPYGQSAFNDTTVASLTDSGLTSTRIPITGAGGLLSDDADLTYDSINDLIETPTGRGATYFIAANDATTAEKAQADIVCDGVNDQVEINAARVKIGRGIIKLSTGNFTIAETGVTGLSVVLSSGIYIDGSGVDATVVHAVAGGAGWDMFANSNALGGGTTWDNHIGITNLTIEGNGAAQIGVCVPIQLQYARNVYFNNLKINEGESYGIHFGQAENVTASNIEITGTLTDPGFAGKVDNLYGSNIRVRNNPLVTGFNIYAGSNWWLVGCLSSYNNEGLYTEAGTNGLHLIDFVATHNTLNGLELTGAITNVEVSSNDISYNGGQGLRITEANDVRVTGGKVSTNANTAVAGHEAGIYLNGSAGNKVYNIIIIGVHSFDDGTGYQDNSLQIRNFADNIRVSDCDFSGAVVKNVNLVGSSYTNVWIKDTYGYIINNHGTSVGTGAQQTIAHGLAFTPTIDQIGVYSDNVNASVYQSANPDATNIYVTNNTSGSKWHWATVGN